MKFLLTSAGIKNTTIHNALVDLLGKPIAESLDGYIADLNDGVAEVFDWYVTSGTSNSTPAGRTP
jgi:hypothetical protein